MFAPARFKGLEDGAEVGASQLCLRRFALQFCGLEDQPEAIDLFAAFHIDLLQSIGHDGGQVLASKQRADQRANGGQWCAHLMGHRFQQAQLMGRWLLRIRWVWERLQSQARGGLSELFGQTRPEASVEVRVIAKRPQICELVAQLIGQCRFRCFEAFPDHSQGIAEALGIAAHQQLSFTRLAVDGEGQLQFGCDHQQQRVIAVP